MTRRSLAVPLVVLAIVMVVGPASAQHVRAAKVGDRIVSLLTGLVPVNGGPLGTCPASAALIVYAQFLVPPRVDVSLFGPLGNHEDDNASFVGFFIGNRFVMLVAFDEQQISTPAEVYADLDGNGMITNVWPAAQAPTLCAIVQQLHYQP
jgi:hypothetical protein